jgi:NhaP-type Na+/H+ or K+/H+ antiporter
MAFLGTGILLGLIFEQEAEIVLEPLLLIGEIALVLILFSDASRINLRVLKGNAQLPARMLVIGLPLIILVGLAIGAATLTGLSLLEAAILATVLAPTDAGLGERVVTSKRVPARIRQALNVESGLNDGIVVPILTVLLALAVAEERLESPSFWVRFALNEMVGGALVGIAIGMVGGWSLKYALKKDWMSKVFQRLAFPALALIAWSLAGLIGGNGFIAAFIGGLAASLTLGRPDQDIADFIEIEGHLLILVVFFIFGAYAASFFEEIDGRILLYAALSLTVVRMLPLAISMIGSRLQRASILFLGWFGPRGLASIVLGMIVIEEASELPSLPLMRTALIATVTLSVFAHGLSASPLIARYRGQTQNMPDDAPEKGEVVEISARKELG